MCKSRKVYVIVEGDRGFHLSCWWHHGTNYRPFYSQNQIKYLQDLYRILVDVRVLQGGGEKNTGWTEHVLCNDYFSTVRAATGKRSSSVERVDRGVNGWSLKQRLGPLKSRNVFYENVLVSGYCQFPNNSSKCFFTLKNCPFKSLNIPARTHR